jgi:hypothetical protein
MAKFNGNKLSGKLGSFVYYQYNGKTCVRKAPGPIDREKLRNDPKLAYMRKNSAEFGRAGKAVKLVREIIQSHIGRISDQTVNNRLQQEMMAVVKSDMLNEWGNRNVMDGNLEFLRDFQFVNSKHVSKWKVDGDHFDHATGKFQVTVSIGRFLLQLLKGAGNYHCTVYCIVMAVDFNTEQHNSTMVEESNCELPYEGFNTITLSGELQAKPGDVVLIATGIEFFCKANFVPVGGGMFDVLQLTEVIQPKEGAQPMHREPTILPVGG